ncbi:hypothetical protein NPIL_320911 [Nephila pilipes]|uniref:Uncharacterized protein n=1 Tax=Nephila pilipes TaxID=299642 RepID=A0A8X6R2S4_NEPPI|nr:hypothetical protein NPIL_320911 [Nephila pilipes]
MIRVFNFLDQRRVNISAYSPYSPNMAPLYFLSFPRLKEVLKDTFCCLTRHSTTCDICFSIDPKKGFRCLVSCGIINYVKSILCSTDVTLRLDKGLSNYRLPKDISDFFSRFDISQLFFIHSGNYCDSKNKDWNGRPIFLRLSEATVNCNKRRHSNGPIVSVTVVGQ